jgi:hypothetical protein
VPHHARRPGRPAARGHDAHLQPVSRGGKRTSGAPPPTRFCRQAWAMCS